MSAEDKDSKQGRVDSHHRARGGEGVVVLGALPLRQFAENFPLSGGCFGEGVGGDLRGVRDWVVVKSFVVGLDGGRGGGKKLRGRWGEQNMFESAAACPLRGGVSGERPLGSVKVPEGIDEARRVAPDLPAEPWPLVVRFKVRSVQLRAHYEVGVAA